MIGDFLYQLSSRDIAGALLIPYHATATNAVAASGIILVLPQLPADQILLMETWSVQANAGAAQTCVFAHVDVLPRGSTQVFQIGGGSKSPAPQQMLYTGAPRKIISPGATLQADFQFNAGAAINAAVFTVTGWLMPRGNLGSV